MTDVNQNQEGSDALTQAMLAEFDAAVSPAPTITTKKRKAVSIGALVRGAKRVKGIKPPSPPTPPDSDEFVLSSQPTDFFLSQPPPPPVLAPTPVRSATFPSLALTTSDPLGEVRAYLVLQFEKPNNITGLNTGLTYLSSAHVCLPGQDVFADTLRTTSPSPLSTQVLRVSPFK